ncbi:hypothetical protein N9Z64_00385 [bacterium]|nr:hypothetical protein [bacterium]
MNDTNQSTPETEALILGHFDNELTEQQESELAQQLATCPEARARFRTQMRMEGRLHSLGRDGFLAPAAVQQASATDGPGSPITQQLSTALESSRPRRTPAIFTSWVAAASTILLLTAWALWPSGVNAASVLRQARLAAQESVDRTYRVTLSNPNDEALEQELTLDIRGGSEFVIRPRDGSYIMGSDGSEFWMTRPYGPVWVTSDYRSLAPALRRRIPNQRILGLATSPNEPLLLDITELLSLISRKYQIELVSPHGSTEHHIRATLRSDKVNVPEKIEFWADAETGVVIKAMTHWPDQNLRTLELLNSDALNQSWYQYPHHAPNAEVRRL